VNLSESIAAGADRLRRMAGALSGLDRDLENLQRDHARAGPQEKFVLGHRLRELQAERSAGNALVEEAERQQAQLAVQHEKAISDVLSNMHNAGHDLDGMAKRFDRLMRDAAALADEMQRAIEPMALTVLPRPAATYVAWPVIVAAMRQAFGDRVPASQRGADQQSMEFAMRLVIRAAGENAARIRADRKLKEEAR